MNTSIRQYIKSSQKTHKKIILDLGCGHDKLKGKPGELVIGIDSNKTKDVDIVYNLEKRLPLPTNFADGIYSNHTFEHIEHVKPLVEECWRVTKPTGIIFLRVPHYTSAGMYTDLTHKTFFSSRSLDYYIKGTYLSTMSGYTEKVRFRLIKKEIVFYPIYKIFQGLVNYSDTTRKIYEYLFCWIIPCNEIVFILAPIKK